MPQTISANNARRSTLPLVVFPCLCLPATFVIAWADANPGGKVFGALEAAQIAAHLRDKAHRGHRLHPWMCLQEVYHRLIGLHPHSDLLEERLAWRTPRTANG